MTEPIDPTDLAISADFPLRFGHLSKFARSPAHYLEARSRDAARADRDQPGTSAMEKGSALHAVVLGTAKVIRYPGKVRSGKQWEAFQAEHAADMILTNAAYEQVMGMAEAVWSDEHAKDLLYAPGVVYEQTLRPDLHGWPCRATPDTRCPGCLVELKSSSTTEPEQFQRHATRMLYHGQLAFYLQACEAAGIQVCRDAYVIAVEATAPHPVVVHQLTERAINTGERAIRLWVERLRSCIAQDFYPGYVQSVIPWDIEEELELRFADDEQPNEEHAA
jgi:hypothetical protein